MRRLAWIGLLVLLLAALPARAAEVSVHEGTPADDRTCGGFPRDITEILVTDGSRLISSMTFCPGYGTAEAQLVDLGKGELYVLVQYRRGRGTGPNHFLTVYKVKSSFVEMITLPVIWNIGTVSSFEYKYAVEPRGEKGFRLVLRGEGDDQGETSCCSLVPDKKNMTIDIETED